MTVPDPGLLDEAAETTTHTEPVRDLRLRCPACGDSIYPTLAYIGGPYTGEQVADGYECDTCPMAWDKRGEVTREKW